MGSIAINQDKKRDLSKTLASLIDDIFVNKKNVWSLLSFFEKLNEKYDYQTVIAVIETTKTYLNSMDFDFPGKYKKTPKLWGFATYISEDKENSFLVEINDCLTHLAEHFKAKSIHTKTGKQTKTKTESQTKSETKSQSSFSLAKSTVWILSLLGCVTPAHTQQHVVNHASTTISGSFVDELPKHYQIIKNAPLPDVEYFIFLDQHNNLTHQLLKKQFVPLVGSPMALLIFEGIQSMSVVPCSNVCLTKDEFMNTYELNIVEEHQCEIKMGFDQFICMGSDEMNTVNKGSIQLEKQREKMKAIAPLINKIQSISEISQEIITHLKSNKLDIAFADKKIQTMLNSINEINKILTDMGEKPLAIDSLTKHSKHIKNVNDVVNFSNAVPVFLKALNESTNQMIAFIQSKENILNDKDALIIYRNRHGIIKTINNPGIKSFFGKKILFWGARHFIPDSSFNHGKISSKVSDTDPQKEVRDFFKDKPHAILYPK